MRSGRSGELIVVAIFRVDVDEDEPLDAGLRSEPARFARRRVAGVVRRVAGPERLVQEN